MGYPTSMHITQVLNKVREGLKMLMSKLQGNKNRQQVSTRHKRTPVIRKQKLILKSAAGFRGTEWAGPKPGFWRTLVGKERRGWPMHEHNKVRCAAAGLDVEFEKGPDNLRPADDLVCVCGIENSPLAVDFSVVHPLQPFADLAGVHQKERARLPACRRFGWSFCPFISRPRASGAARPIT